MSRINNIKELPFPIYDILFVFNQVEERKKPLQVHSNSESRTKSCVMRTQVMIKG